VSAWGSYIHSLASGLRNGKPAQGLPIGAYPPHNVPQDHGHDHCDELNAPFTVEHLPIGNPLEKLATLQSCLGMSNPLRTRGGGDPYSRNMLKSVLADIFSTALRQRTIRAESHVCLVTPVYKKGDAYDKGNYRPIAVGEYLIRLYADVLNPRFLPYLEKYGLRVDCQAGFRPEMCTTHQLYSLLCNTHQLYICYTTAHRFGNGPHSTPFCIPGPL
jgi:hypothetical protein